MHRRMCMPAYTPCRLLACTHTRLSAQRQLLLLQLQRALFTQSPFLPLPQWPPSDHEALLVTSSDLSDHEALPAMLIELLCFEPGRSS